MDMSNMLYITIKGSNKLMSTKQQAKKSVHIIYIYIYIYIYIGANFVFFTPLKVIHKYYLYTLIRPMGNSNAILARILKL